MRKRAFLILAAAMSVWLVSFAVVYSYAQQLDVFTVTATPNRLWPPNGKMVPIQLDVFCNWQNNSCTRTNPCSCCAQWHIVSVKSHEPISTDDYIIDNSRRPPALFLKSERLGNGRGRAYIIEVAEDTNLCCTNPTATTTVLVPHDQGM